MRLKLDENLGRRGAEVLGVRGHDVATVAGQDLCSASDATLAEVCRVEGRVLVTFDVDFANPFRFRPKRYAGLVVLRLSEPVATRDIDDALARVLELTETRDPKGRLWIVDSKRIREYADESDDCADE